MSLEEQKEFEKTRKLLNPENKTEYFTKIAFIYNLMNLKERYKFNQINNFKWINIKAVNEIIKLKSDFFSKNSEFEKK